MFCWNLLAAFILLSIEDFYQISANEFIDSIVITLGKVGVRLHINHRKNGHGHKKRSVSFGKSQHWIWVRWRKTVVFLFFWPLIWLYSPVHKGQKQQAVDYTSLIISDIDTEHTTWGALWTLDTLFVPIYHAIW